MEMYDALYVIVAPGEYADDDSYWSRNDGWGRMYDASLYSEPVGFPADITGHATAEWVQFVWAGPV